MTLLFVPIIVPLLFCESAFIAMGQDPYISQQAAIYVKICLPGIMCYNYGNCLSRYCSGQRETRVGMYSNIFGTLAHIAIVYWLCIHLKYEMFGVAVASSIHFLVRLLVFVVFIYFSPKLRGGL